MIRVSELLWIILYKQRKSSDVKVDFKGGGVVLEMEPVETEHEVYKQMHRPACTLSTS